MGHGFLSSPAISGGAVLFLAPPDLPHGAERARG